MQGARCAAGRFADSMCRTRHSEQGRGACGARDLSGSLDVTRAKTSDKARSSALCPLLSAFRSLPSALCPLSSCTLIA